MEKGKLLIGLFIFVMLVGIIQASTLKVNVLTLENHKLEIVFMNAENSAPSVDYRFSNDTGDGIISFVVDKDIDSYNIHCYLTENGEKILYKNFEDISSDQEIQLLLLPGMSEITENYEESTTFVSDDSENQDSANETAQNETETNSANETENTSSSSSESENKNASSSKLGGFAVVNQALGGIFTNKVFYYVGLVIILGLVGFMVARRVYKKGTFKFKLPKKKNSNTGAPRGKERIEEAKKKLVEDEKELMRLRKEEKDKED